MIGFIGGGNMAEALIRGMTVKGMRDIMVSEPRDERRAYLERAFGIKSISDNRGLVSACSVIVLAVKPQDMAEVLEEIGPVVSEDKAVVSIAAGVTLAFLGERLRTGKLVRAMPNVASMVQEGMAVISLCECFSDKDVNVVKDIFMSSGRVLMMPEKYLNAVTALSGSGPAFIAHFLGFMVEAGVGLGLREQEALELGLQTLIGTAKLLDSGITPKRLVEMVRSPGGTTEAGLKALDEEGLGGMVAKALEAASRRAGELAR
jgi:pyrroline-5-carboxylate reductase